ncbi:hypothetical protein Nepgr_004454 [Nepenthes gracilis]|uniref:Uncharacterized protein n=1 Tax=Nepenthes gracilis TaxID=150966 RepID=A0AAD3S1E2_NEPGR|nr:hypothetical protein Nepgr_004454 [Nepenthes gracilis]
MEGGYMCHIIVVKTNDITLIPYSHSLATGSFPGLCLPAALDWPYGDHADHVGSRSLSPATESDSFPWDVPSSGDTNKESGTLARTPSWAAVRATTAFSVLGSDCCRRSSSSQQLALVLSGSGPHVWDTSPCWPSPSRYRIECWPQLPRRTGCARASPPLPAWLSSDLWWWQTKCQGYFSSLRLEVNWLKK